MEEDPDDTAWLEAEAPMEEYSVTVLLGPAGSLFQQIRSAISWQYGRLKGVKTEIQILGQGLQGLCADLKDLSEAEDTITRCWVRQVRDLCYDTSDYLDELMYFIHCYSGTRPRTRLLLKNHPPKITSKKKKIFWASRRPVCNQLRPSLTKMNKLKRVPLIAKLSALVARVEDADERRRRFKITPPEASKHDYTQVTGASYLMPKLPLELHVDNLIKLLGFDHDQDERNLKLATIFGSAGGGKTALARTLYHKFRGRFQYRAFLRVSRDPDMRRLLTDLLTQIKAPSAHAFFDVEGLIATITKYLQGKRDGGHDLQEVVKRSCSTRTTEAGQVVVMLRVSLHCKGCAGKVKKHIAKMEGVTSFDIDMATKKVTVVGNVTPLGVLNSVSKVKPAQFWSSSLPPPRSSTDLALLGVPDPPTIRPKSPTDLAPPVVPEPPTIRSQPPTDLAPPEVLPCRSCRPPAAVAALPAPKGEAGRRAAALKARFGSFDGH